jgi:hypothetical protein
MKNNERTLFQPFQHRVPVSCEKQYRAVGLPFRRIAER